MVDAEENEKPHRINTIRFKHWIKDIWIRFAYIGLFGTFDHVGSSHVFDVEKVNLLHC